MAASVPPNGRTENDNFMRRLSLEVYSTQTSCICWSELTGRAILFCSNAWHFDAGNENLWGEFVVANRRYEGFRAIGPECECSLSRNELLNGRRKGKQKSFKLQKRQFSHAQPKSKGHTANMTRSNILVCAEEAWLEVCTIRIKRFSHS